MIKVQNLQKKFKNFQLDCSLEVRPGMVTGLVGQNGSGKSTTFKAILGLISKDGGQISVLGKEPAELTAEDKEKIGVVFCNSGFSRYMTIKDIVPILKSFYKEFDEKSFLEKTEKFKLPLNKKISEFSTGMKAQLQLLAAVSYNAKVLILDEPTAGLDVVARDEMLDILREFMEQDEERSVLISSHISGDLENFCDDIYMIHEGKIILHEDTDVLLSDYGILKTDEKQFEKIDKDYIIRFKKENYGYRCITNQKQYYAENYPDIVIEKGTLDDIILLMARGNK